MKEATGAVSRRIYIPNMSDHSQALAAAMRHHGSDAEVLPAPTEESLSIGMQDCQGRECMPCFLCVGDFLLKAREPGFDPANTLFFLPTTSGPCRFGQYPALLEDVLDRHGYGEARIVSPTGSQGYAWVGENPSELRKLVWQGFVAVDLLYRLLHEFRPYEPNRGETEAAYADSLRDVIGATEAGGGKGLRAALRSAVERFRALSIDRNEERPVVGIVGEFYVRWNAFSNRDLIREVEALGGEVVVSTLTEMLYYTNYRVVSAALASGNYRGVLAPTITDLYQSVKEHQLHRIVAPLLRRPDEKPIHTLIRALRPYYDARLGTEAVLSLGRAIEYARAGFSGILNVLPFSCMPGVIVGGMAPRIRRDLDYIPWLDIPYDAQKGTNIRTRLEAFMHQVRQFQRRGAKRAEEVAAGAAG